MRTRWRHHLAAWLLRRAVRVDKELVSKRLEGFVREFYEPVIRRQVLAEIREDTRNRDLALAAVALMYEGKLRIGAAVLARVGPRTYTSVAPDPSTGDLVVYTVGRPA